MITVEPASSGRRRINRSALTRFLLEAQAAMGRRGEVNVLLAGNRTLHRLNLDFRKKDNPTDVLSFPAPESAKNADEAWIGDLAISIDIAAENAGRFGHSLEMELKVLLLHGLLHLAGYDHETDHGAMARKERALRKQLGLEVALIERTAAMRGQPNASSKGQIVKSQVTKSQTLRRTRGSRAALRSGNHLPAVPAL